jgi:hypothetical protein
MLADTVCKTDKPVLLLAIGYTFVREKARQLAVCVGENEHSASIGSIEIANKNG